MENSRHLIYVPVVHTRADMGSMSDSLKKEYIEKYGEKKWKQHITVVEEMWEGLKSRIMKLQVDWALLRVYQDGLPLCGKERNIVEDLAAKGSKNHEILLWLIQNGANLEGTENPQLLLEEYNHIKKIAEVQTQEERKKAVKEFQNAAQELLEKRDHFIKERIGNTLRPGETGILFMGLLHKVDEGLPKDIKVSYLIHRLPFKRQFEVDKI